MLMYNACYWYSLITLVFFVLFVITCVFVFTLGCCVGGDVGVLQRRWGQSGLRLGGRRVMGLRGGKNANALSLRIKPLSLEHEGRTRFYRCARSCGIIGGGVRPIFDSLAGGGGVRVRQR